MGASTVAAHLILFVAVLGITTGLVILLTNYIAQTGSVISSKQNFMIDQLKTNIDISSVANTSTSNIPVYVKNIGDITLKTSCIDLYLDSGWCDNFTVVNPNTGANVSLWQSKDTLLLNATLNSALNTNLTHTAKVVTCNGVSDSFLFSI
ncbi:MAG: hypothetical protein KAJ10_12655 [Thermodesulfovibrionia bacterium]|nr:hypothetical protein [Thermodesulfovibrionia bacterium]